MFNKALNLNYFQQNLYDKSHIKLCPCQFLNLCQNHHKFAINLNMHILLFVKIILYLLRLRIFHTLITRVRPGITYIVAVEHERKFMPPSIVQANQALHLRGPLDT